MEGGQAVLISDTSPGSTLQDVVITTKDEEPDQSLIISNDNDKDCKDGCWVNFNLTKWLFSVIVISNYMTLAFVAVMKTSTAVHLFTWFFAVLATTYMLLVWHTLLFSKQLCYHTVEYDLQRGSSSNYLPRQINVHHQVPYETICMSMCGIHKHNLMFTLVFLTWTGHIAHIRGTTINKWHTTLIGYGAVIMICAAIVRIFDGYNGVAPLSVKDNIAIIFWMLASIGGLFAVNFEIYVSPSFSKRWNCTAHALHVFGGCSYGLCGTFAYAAFCQFNFVSCLMIFCSLMLAVLWKCSKYYQQKKSVIMFANEDQKNEDWVHFMSQINVGIEVIGLFISSICLICLGYQM